MLIKKMDDKLIKINQIENIRSIKFKDLYSSENDKFLVIPGFMVETSESGILYLTSQDEYFEDFVRKIREQYLVEKDRVFEDGILGEQKLEIDQLTKSMLENGNVDTTSDLYSFYKEKTSYDESLLFEEDKLKAFRGIITYHLKDTMKVLDTTIRNLRLSHGANGIYCFNAEVNNTPTIIPIYFEQTDENTYKVSIGNLFEKSIPLNMEILFTKDGIVVNNTIEEYGISDYTKYEFKDCGTIERQLVIDGKLKHYDKRNLPSTVPINKNLVALDNVEEIITWYKLPWNAYEGITEKNECIEPNGTLSDVEGNNRIVTKRLVYLAEEGNNFFIRDSVSKRYRKKHQKTQENIEVLFDNIEKQIIGISQKDGFVIETSFTGNAVTGFYKTNLLGKYFYHIVKQKNKEELSKDTLIPIGKEDGLEENVDLIDIKKYTK